MAGTQVIVGLNADGSYQTENIEDLQAGDWVWSRDQSAEDDDASLHQVARVFKKVSDHLRIVQIRDADGNVETIQTTDEHPFWVAGRGWTAARDLAAGDKLNEADDSDDATVVSSVREEHPEGVAVYNFEVQGDHTYFVEDGHGLQTAVWVHNTCGPAHEFRRYIRDVERETGVRIGKEQRRLLADAVRSNSFPLLSKADYAAHTAKFDAASVIAEWERQTKDKWPRYHMPVFSKQGEVIRDIDDLYDLHHLIEQNRGGPHVWWNAHPARYPDQHQGGIHRSGGVLRELND